MNGNSEPFMMANCLNSHFANAGANISNNEIPDIIYRRQMPDDTDRPQLNEISIQDFGELLTTLSPAKACGTDGIMPGLISACHDTILEPLHYIFKLSITTMKFLSMWKIGKIMPKLQEHFPFCDLNDIVLGSGH